MEIDIYYLDCNIDANVSTEKLNIVLMLMSCVLLYESHEWKQVLKCYNSL